PTDSTAMLLNEAAVHAMKIKNPIGLNVRANGTDWHVVGVIKNFILGSPYEQIKPMVVEGPVWFFQTIHFRLNPDHTAAEDLAKAEKIFRKYNPQYPFEYYFVDENYARKFIMEQRTGTLAGLFAGLAIVISCLGLFGLATYMAETRLKEIGVRKVLGASVVNITMMISRDFIRLVIISILIASPIAWYAMNTWLQNFNYRIQIAGWIFLMAGLLAILIALITVSYQAIKAARANPIKSLRTQ
ncbi:MAG TPA: FtsX-like permease family protein, partial [Puia sp.]|nr:FtsX-like permease family protein [Puia sp.]